MNKDEKLKQIHKDSEPQFARGKKPLITTAW